MVSEETPRGAAIDKHECGDNEAIKPIDSSSPSSSEGSGKVCPEVDDSPDNSGNDDCGFQSHIRNATYKIDTDDTSNSEDVNGLQDIDESEFVNNESTLQLISSNESEENSEFDPSTWLHRAFVNLTNKFDSSSLFIIDSDSKIGNLTLEESRLMYENMDDCLIVRARNYLSEYQAMRGVPRDEYNFCTLIKLMGHASGHSLQALYTFMLNIVPVLEIFLHITRFILDKAISIKNGRDAQNVFINSVIFAIELFIIYICITVIFGYIVSPVIRIPFGIIGKMLLYT